MTTAENRVPTAPPSLINALLAGFDSITNHIELIAIPILLDVFLWLGPRLRLEGLIKRLVDQMAGLSGVGTAGVSESWQTGQDIWYAFAERFNLFTVLRAFPVGIPSLISSSQPAATPFGAPPGMEISSGLAGLSLWIGLGLVGLVLGSLYYLIVAQASLNGRVSWREALQQWPKAAYQVVLLAVFWVALLATISIPASCLITLTALSGLSIARFGLILLGGVALWMLFPLIFSAHGIFIKGMKMWASVLESIRLTRLTFIKTSLLFACFLIISEGFDLLWRVPEETSWLTIVGIVGHAFTTTSLLAASFVYYQNSYRWIQRLIQQAKFSSAPFTT